MLANPEQLHALTFYSASASMVANEYVEVMRDPKAIEATGCGHVAVDEGEYPTMPAASTQLLMRYSLAVEAPTLFSAALAISGEDLRACTRLFIVDNAAEAAGGGGQGEAAGTGVQELPLGRHTAAVELRPTPEGYTIVGLSDVPHADTALLPTRPGAAAPSRGGGVSEEGAWALTVSASQPPSLLEAVPCTRTQSFEGSYQANQRAVLARHILVPTAPTQLALLVRVRPALPFRLRLMRVQGGEVAWGKEDYPLAIPEVLSGPDGTLWLPNATLPPGKYVAHLELIPAACPEGFRPSPVDGRMMMMKGREAGNGAALAATSSAPGAAAVTWKAVFMPSSDDKVCPIIADDSQAKYLRAMFDTWGAAGVPGAPPAKAPPPPPKGALAAPGGPRAVAAAALVDRLLKEGGEGGGGGSRTLKDGTVLTLDPESRLTRLPPVSSSASSLTGSGASRGKDKDKEAAASPVVLSKEQLAERVAAQEAAAKAAVSGGIGSVPSVSARLEQGKGSRAALGARATSEFSQWRGRVALEARGAVKARARAALEVKQAKERETAAAGGLSE